MYGGVYIGPNGNDVQTPPPAVTSGFRDLQLYEADRYDFVSAFTWACALPMWSIFSFPVLYDMQLCIVPFLSLTYVLNFVYICVKSNTNVLC